MICSIRLGRVCNAFQRGFLGVFVGLGGYIIEWFVSGAGGVGKRRERMVFVSFSPGDIKTAVEEVGEALFGFCREESVGSAVLVAELSWLVVLVRGDPLAHISMISSSNILRSLRERMISFVVLPSRGFPLSSLILTRVVGFLGVTRGSLVGF